MRGNYAEGYLVCNERSKDGYIMNFPTKRLRSYENATIMRNTTVLQNI